jgi:glycosyltransferase involved in cell wall biosynthesis
MIVFGEDWGAHPSSTQHLISHLAQGRKVLWVNSVGMRAPRLNTNDVLRAMSKALKFLGRQPGTRGNAAAAPFPVVQPLILPMARSSAGRALNRHLIARKVGRAAAAAGLHNPVLWLSMPSAADAIGALDHCGLVYYAGDDFAALTGVDHAAAAELEAEVAGRAGLIIAASDAIARKFPSNKTATVPHGVDLALFTTPAERPADLPDDVPVAGFYGSIADWIDVKMVAAAARELPHWRFMMIGSVQTDITPLTSLPNVIFLGPRPHAALPGYAQHWHAGIIPFRDTAQIRACNPLKLREYLAAGRPVISTPFPALKPYAHLASTVRNAGEMVQALRDALTDQPEAAARRKRAVAAEDWVVRAAEISALIDPGEQE